MSSLGNTSISAGFAAGGLPQDVGFAGYSGPFAVLNSSVLVDNDEAEDVYEMLNGVGAGNANILPLVVPNNGVFLELRLYMIGTPAITFTVDPIVNVYGKVPGKDVHDDNRKYPEDVNAATFTQTLEADGGFWVPLYRTTGTESVLDPTTHPITLEAATGVVQCTPATGVAFALSPPVWVALTGVEQVLVAVSVLASGGGATDGMVIGRVIGPIK